MEKIIGINPVMEALKSEKEMEYIEIYSKNKNEKIKKIVDIADKRGVQLKYINERNENSQGVTAYIKEYDYYTEFNEFLEKLSKKDAATVLVLDGIQDPGNFGALIRSAETFGVSGIIIPTRRSVQINKTVIKTSTGAIEYLDIVQVVNITQALDSLKKIDFWVYGAEADGAKSLHDEKYPKKTCLVLGSEGKGMRAKVKEHCDQLIKIPMFGKINSLNVSVAGGIMLAEISKYRRV